MHTKSYGGRTIDIDKLLEIVKHHVPINKEITSLDLSTIDITRNSGFSEKRFRNADITKPIIVDYNYGIVDGRHRILKSLLSNKSVISCIRVERLTINKCAID
jgi:hypothetical protein